MGDYRLVITEPGFLTEFLNQHTHRPERPFCFIVGAGVSRSSGILTGAEMANIWLRELHEAENLGGLSLEEWATAEQLGIDGFTMASLANFYPQLYRRKYGDNEQGGFAFLESQMEGKEPSYGYSVLSYLLSETPHRVVITTNFDNLVTDALSIHSSKFPLVIGHDSLAQYATVELRRPLVAKVHGALGLSPKSQPDELSHLPEGWCIALKRILDRYTPIVIGYEGNDGSLMGFLKKLPPDIPDRVFWCVYAPDARGMNCLKLVSDEVREYVQSRRGRFVPIRGFDELMAKLLTKLREKGSVPDLYERLKQRARQREQSYDEQQRRLFESAIAIDSREPAEGQPSNQLNADSDLSDAVSEIAESRKEKPWWVWMKEASAEKDTAVRRNIYLQALEAYPDNVDVLRTYGLFLEVDAKEPENAAEVYKHAMETSPTDPLTPAFYGLLLQRLGKLDAAEEHYQRALDIGPNLVYSLTVYARFLQHFRKDMNKAEELYERALKLDASYKYAVESYTDFLRTVRNNPEKAKEIERKSKSVSKSGS